MPVDTNVIERFRKSTVRTLVASTPEERVVLVNENDEAIGIEDKTEAHRLGKLHRAFSVFVVNSAGQLLVQRRALTKYHSRGLWSNTCCGHPRPGETIALASRRRLREEMGFESNLNEVFSFVYRANLEDELIENEYDHVLVGFFDGVPNPDPAEISEWRWLDPARISLDVKRHPQNYTYWFRICFGRFLRFVHPTVDSILDLTKYSS